MMNKYYKKEWKQVGTLRPNPSALAKPAAYLQSIMLFLAEPEMVKIKDDVKDNIFFYPQYHGSAHKAIN